MTPMSSDESAAAAALMAEIDSAIADIKTDRGMTRCPAHDAIARGLIVVLRCQRAQLELARRSALMAAGVGGIVGGAVAAAAWVIQRLW